MPLFISCLDLAHSWPCSSESVSVARLLDRKGFVSESGSASGLGFMSHCVAEELGHLSLGLCQVVWVGLLVHVHAFGVLSDLRILHKVGLWAHVGVRLRSLDRVWGWLCDAACTFGGLGPYKVLWGARFVVVSQAVDVVSRELCCHPLWVETSVWKSRTR